MTVVLTNQDADDLMEIGSIMHTGDKTPIPTLRPEVRSALPEIAP
jgi:hypothetical protein